MKAKENIKSSISYVLSRSKRPIVVSSMGRSGSTMLTGAIVKSAHKYDVVKRHKTNIIKSYLKRLPPRRRGGVIYKTHDYPPNSKDKSTRYVYIYDYPMKVIASLQRKRREEGDSWLKKHAYNMNSKREVSGGFFEEDVFCLEDHFDAWVGAENISVALIRLDQLWKNKEKLSGYLGFEVELPEKRKRNSSLKNVPKSKVREANRVYKNLKNKVSKYDFKIRCAG